MIAELTARRRRRATLAHRLAEYRERTADQDDEWRRLRWSALERLPEWVTLDERAIDRLRLLAGAVSVAPAIRRTVRGDVLEQLGSRIGTGALDTLRRRPYRIVDPEIALVAGAALDVLLKRRGVEALVAQVEDDTARRLLATALTRDLDVDVERCHAAVDPVVAQIAWSLLELPSESEVRVRKIAPSGAPVSTSAAVDAGPTSASLPHGEPTSC